MFGVRLAGRVMRFSTEAGAAPLQRTVLHSLHCELGGKMVPFAGWDMPLSYAGLGAIDSHLWTRDSASLFDVSHMGQIV